MASRVKGPMSKKQRRACNQHGGVREESRDIRRISHRLLREFR